MDSQPRMFFVFFTSFFPSLLLSFLFLVLCLCPLLKLLTAVCAALSLCIALFSQLLLLSLPPHCYLSSSLSLPLCLSFFLSLSLSFLCRLPVCLPNLAFFQIMTDQCFVFIALTCSGLTFNFQMNQISFFFLSILLILFLSCVLFSPSVFLVARWLECWQEVSCQCFFWRPQIHPWM